MSTCDTDMEQHIRMYTCVHTSDISHEESAAYTHTRFICRDIFTSQSCNPKRLHVQNRRRKRIHDWMVTSMFADWGEGGWMPYTVPPEGH